MKQGIFVTGTGTDVGKTYISALLLKHLRADGMNAGYFKAALSGATRKDGHLIPGDAKYVCDVAGITDSPASHVAYLYEDAVSPHLAAQWAGHPIELETVQSVFEKTAQRYDFIVAEGSGGIVCPLRGGENMLLLTDVMRLLGFPLVIVAPSGLGAINSAVLTASYAKAQGFSVKGFILNSFDPQNAMHLDNRKMIETLTGLPVIAYAAQNADCLCPFTNLI